MTTDYRLPRVKSDRKWPYSGKKKKNLKNPIISKTNDFIEIVIIYVNSKKSSLFQKSYID